MLKDTRYLLDRVRILLEGQSSGSSTDTAIKNATEGTQVAVEAIQVTQADIVAAVEAIELSSAAIELAIEATQEAQQGTLGQYGSKRVTGTDAVTPDSGYEFFAIQAEEDTVVNTAVGNMTGIAGMAITAEGIRYGTWTSVTLTSGKAILYQRPEV
jgi:hypothetical protein